MGRPRKNKGLGDVIANVTTAIGIEPCDGCNRRKDQLNKFYQYWIEPNKSKTKLKWQMQKTWDLQMRVNKWFNNAEIWEAKNAK